jgi:hypothetical protein
MSCPLFVELCAGTAALSLRLHAGRSARPPVSRMGAKTGYANVILRVLGLRPGQGQADGTRYVWCEPDAGVRLLLEAYRDRELAQAAAEIIRGWKDEDPRALWERLRAEGPARHVCEPREVARWAWVRRRSAHAKGDGYHAGNETHKIDPESPAAVVESATGLPAAIHPDAREVEPREVARWALLGQWAYRAGHPESGFNAGRLVDREPTPTGGNGAKARTCEQEAGLWSRVPKSALSATIHPDARAIEPPTLPPGTVVYMDPPYLNTTGYAHDLGRDEVVRLARRWADAGATVCISEAEPIPDLVAEGWHAVEITGERKGQRRTFSRQQAEWLTLNRAPAWVPSVQASLFGAA